MTPYFRELFFTRVQGVLHLKVVRAPFLDFCSSLKQREWLLVGKGKGKSKGFQLLGFQQGDVQIFMPSAGARTASIRITRKSSSTGTWLLRGCCLLWWLGLLSGPRLLLPRNVGDSVASRPLLPWLRALLSMRPGVGLHLAAWAYWGSVYCLALWSTGFSGWSDLSALSLRMRLWDCSLWRSCSPLGVSLLHSWSCLLGLSQLSLLDLLPPHGRRLSGLGLLCRDDGLCFDEVWPGGRWVRLMPCSLFLTVAGITRGNQELPFSHSQLYLHSAEGWPPLLVHSLSALSRLLMGVTSGLPWAGRALFCARIGDSS